MSGFDFSAAPQIIEATPSLLLAFLDGLVAFVSPCILPLLPVYGIYMLGEGPLMGREKNQWGQLLVRMAGFALGFIPFFVILGAGAGALGNLIKNLDGRILEYITGGLLIIFGLMMLDTIPGLRLFTPRTNVKALSGGGFVKMMLLGVTLALSWTPCLTPLLGNVLMMVAGSGGSVGNGMLLLFMFALGLTIPFLLCMALYAKLGGMIAFLKKHHRTIRIIAGIAMIILGILYLVGVM